MPVSVGVAYVDVRPDLAGFSREMSTGMRRIGDDAGRSLSASLSSAAKFAVAGLGLSKLTGFLSGATEAASSLAETVAFSRTVFDDAAAEMEAWAKGAAQSVGLSQRAALEAAVTFGNMFVQLGLNADEAARLSQSLVALGSDFASARNANIEDVLAAQASAFRGEYDALQRFLPLINAATVDQRALALTGKSATKELTAQDRALAVNALMFEGAGDAAGDFRRTMDSLANQQRQTSAEMENSSATIGETLIPLKKEWARVIRETLIPAFTDLFSTGGSATSWAANLQNVVGDAVGWLVGILQQTLRLMANFFDKLPTGLGEGVADDLRTAADAGDGFRDKMHASKLETQAFAQEATGAAGATEALGDATNKTAAGLSTMGNAMKTTLGSMLDPMRAFGEEAKDTLGLNDVKDLLNNDKEWEGSYRKLSAAARAGVEPAADAAKKTVVSIGDLRRHLTRGIGDVKEWVADLNTLKDRGFAALAGELAALGPDAAAAVDQATRLGSGALGGLEGLFAERARLLGDPFITGLSDSLTAAAPQIATDTTTALHNALVAAPPVLSPEEAVRVLGIGGLLGLPLGPQGPVAPQAPPLINVPGYTSQPGSPAPAAAPTSAVGTINVYPRTDANPHEIALEVADAAAWRLGRPPGGRNLP